MFINPKPMSGFVLVLLALLFSQTLCAKMYRWVDKDGSTYYSDQVPPQHNKYRREVLSDHAMVLEIKEKEKTRAQMKHDLQLEQLRKEQEKIILKQKSHDRVLLSTFRSEEDMRMTLAGKLRAITAQQNVSKGNQTRLEKQLLLQQKNAADYERNGKKIPSKKMEGILSTEEQIRLVIKEIEKYNDKKTQIKNIFAADIERFLLLTHSETPEPDKHPDAILQPDTNTLGLFTCNDESACKLAWKAARKFILKHSTSAIDIDSGKLIMTRKPDSDADFSLSVAKIMKDNATPQFFLDINCRKSTLGKELCASQKANEIRSAFKPFITSNLESPFRGGAE